MYIFYILSNSSCNARQAMACWLDLFYTGQQDQWVGDKANILNQSLQLLGVHSNNCVFLANGIGMIVIGFITSSP